MPTHISDLVDQIGCNGSTIYKALRRLGITRQRGAALTRHQIRRLKRAINPDRRGHWPAGRTRNDTPDDWPEVRERLITLFAGTSRARAIQRGISRKQLAQHLGVSDRTVRRWMSGEDGPTGAAVRGVAAWTKRFRRK